MAKEEFDCSQVILQLTVGDALAMARGMGLPLDAEGVRRIQARLAERPEPWVALEQAILGAVAEEVYAQVQA